MLTFAKLLVIHIVSLRRNGAGNQRSLYRRGPAHSRQDEGTKRKAHEEYSRRCFGADRHRDAARPDIHFRKTFPTPTIEAKKAYNAICESCYCERKRLSTKMTWKRKLVITRELERYLRCKHREWRERRLDLLETGCSPYRTSTFHPPDVPLNSPVDRRLRREEADLCSAESPGTSAAAGGIGRARGLRGPFRLLRSRPLRAPAANADNTAVASQSLQQKKGNFSSNKQSRNWD